MTTSSRLSPGSVRSRKRRVRSSSTD
uniref:Uncharacterized protein n=1 Tax=Arundo donax TaxID=35708 RepID=A0A0A9AAW2_ARUDO